MIEGHDLRTGRERRHAWRNETEVAFHGLLDDVDALTRDMRAAFWTGGQWTNPAAETVHDRLVMLVRTYRGGPAR